MQSRKIKIDSKDNASTILDFIGEKEIYPKSKVLNFFKKFQYFSRSGPELDVVYGNILERILATAIDIGIILTAFLISETFLFSYDYSNSQYNIYRIAIGIVVWVLYNASLESSEFQATFGEMILKLEVIDLFGKRLNFITAAIRSVFFVFSALALGLGLWTIFKDQKRQGLHDIFSGSYVIKTY